MKYLVYYDGKFKEFQKWNDAEYFMLDKPNTKCKKITSKKVEEEFRLFCESNPELVSKIYVVIVNGQVKRFEKWKDAKEYIGKNPNAKYKSFTDENEAQIFANLNVHGKTAEDVYGFTNQKGEAYIVKDGKQDKIADIPGNSIERELKGTLLIIDAAILRGEERILIKYRNLGTEMWANRTWKANKAYAIQYQNRIEELRKRINVDYKNTKES